MLPKSQTQSDLSLWSGPLVLSEPCGVRQATISYICSERGIIFDTVRLEPIKLFGGAHWLEVSIFSSDVKFQKCALVASIAYLSKDPRMVRAFGPL